MLEFWNLSADASIKKGQRWNPTREKAKNDVDWAEFADSQHLLTCSRGGKLVLWRWPQIEPLAAITTAPLIAPALSPDGKYFAFQVGPRLALLDIEACKIVATKSVGKEGGAICFSPDGQKIALATTGKICVWNMANGKSEYRLIVDGSVHPQKAIWPSLNGILVNSERYFDLELRSCVWTYHGGEKCDFFNGKVWFFLSGNGNDEEGLVPLSLPQKEATEKIAKAKRSPSLYFLKPGGSVKLEIKGFPAADQRMSVRQTLTSKLTALGVTIDEDSDVTLQAKYETGEVRKDTIGPPIGMGFLRGPFGPRSPNVQAIAVQTYDSTLRFVYQNKTAWSVKTLWPPMGRIQSDESGVDDEREGRLAAIRFFESADLPDTLVKPQNDVESGEGALGSTEITIHGLQPYVPPKLSPKQPNDATPSPNPDKGLQPSNHKQYL